MNPALGRRICKAWPLHGGCNRRAAKIRGAHTNDEAPRRRGVRWSRFFGQVVKVDSRAEEEAPRWPGRDGGSRGEFKARVALEALRERDSVQAIAARHELHANQVTTWKRQLLEGLPEVFAGGAGRKAALEHEAKIRDLHAKIGELTVERDFFRRGLKR